MGSVFHHSPRPRGVCSWMSPNLQETLGWDEVYNGTEWSPGAKDWKHKNIRYIDPQFAGHNFLDFTLI